MITFHVKRFLLAVGAIAMAFGVAGTYAAAHPQNTSPDRPPFRGRGMGPGPAGGPLELLLGRGGERLGLTEAQQSQLKSILDAHKSDMQMLMKQVGDARHALVAAQINGQSDDQIRQLWGAVSDAESQMAIAQTHVIAEAMQVLTADQQAQLKQMVTQGGPRGRRGRP
jgi:Spy/CpxP family protein refolding chaperone